jgi:hypothetical protein
VVGSRLADIPPLRTLAAGAVGSEPKKFCDLGRARARAAFSAASLCGAIRVSHDYGGYLKHRKNPLRPLLLATVLPQSLLLLMVRGVLGRLLLGLFRSVFALLLGHLGRGQARDDPRGGGGRAVRVQGRRGRPRWF